MSGYHQSSREVESLQAKILANVQILKLTDSETELLEAVFAVLKNPLSLSPSGRRRDPRFEAPRPADFARFAERLADMAPELRALRAKRPLPA